MKPSILNNRQYHTQMPYRLSRRSGVFGPLLVLFLAIMALWPSTGWASSYTIVVLGDSLSAGFGLPLEQALTSRLEQALKAEGFDVKVPNTAVSGDTTAGGVSRLEWLLADKPDLVIVALGGNDVLRALDPAATRANLNKILTRLAAAKIPAILAGMLAAPNLGPEYAAAFNPIYPDLAKAYGVPLLPFLLDGVALDPRYTIADGMHPNAAGVDIMVGRLLPLVRTSLRAISG